MNSSSRMPSSSSSENRANQGSSNQNREPCRHYQRGICTWGEECGFPHSGVISREPCRHYQRGICTLGEECRFPHSGVITREPCRFYQRGNCTPGEGCRFFHPSGVITRERERPYSNFRYQIPRNDAVSHFAHGQTGIELREPPRTPLHQRVQEYPLVVRSG